MASEPPRFKLFSCHIFCFCFLTDLSTGILSRLFNHSVVVMICHTYPAFHAGLSILNPFGIAHENKVTEAITCFSTPATSFTLSHLSALCPRLFHRCYPSTFFSLLPPPPVVNFSMSAAGHMLVYSPKNQPTRSEICQPTKTELC